jgi:hypothetical protein
VFSVDRARDVACKLHALPFASAASYARFRNFCQALLACNPCRVVFLFECRRDLVAQFLAAMTIDTKNIHKIDCLCTENSESRGKRDRSLEQIRKVIDTKDCGANIHTEK